MAKTCDITSHVSFDSLIRKGTACVLPGVFPRLKVRWFIALNSDSDKASRAGRTLMLPPSDSAQGSIVWRQMQRTA